MSVIPRDCKIVRKSDALPEFINLKLVEAKYKGVPQMRAVKDLVQDKDPDIEKKVRAIGAYLGQHTHDFHVRENCLCMDERLVIPVPLRKAVVNGIHCFHPDRTKMFDAASDVCFPSSTGVWWRARMGAKNAPKQLKALNQCAPKVTLGRFTNLGSLTMACN